MSVRMGIAKGRSVLLLAAIALIFVALPGAVITYWLGRRDHKVVKPIRPRNEVRIAHTAPSPNGAYTAYVETRTTAEGTRSRLFVRKGSEPARAVMDVDEGEDPRRSTDSKMVAVVDCVVSGAVYIYDVTTGHAGKARLPARPWSDARPSWKPREDHWEWHGDSTILVFRQIEGSRYDIARVSISDSTSTLRLQVSHDIALVNDLLP